MSAGGDHKRPIIIKRVSGDHDEAHGGQWKVAYADFVTAMMAFFLVMWLLSVTTENQRAGVAKYFNTSSILDMRTGDGMLDGGKSVLEGADTKVEKLVMSREDGGLPSRTQTQGSADPVKQHDQVERQRLEAVKAQLERMVNAGELASVADTVSMEIIPDGLRIQVFDRDNEAMFVTGSAEPTSRLVRVLGVVGQVLGTITNPVVLTGYTDDDKLQRGNYSNWELSADRANAARRLLETSGVGAERMLKVEGRAATAPLLPEAPDDPRNRRIAVTILRSDAAARLSATAR